MAEYQAVQSRLGQLQGPGDPGRMRSWAAQRSAIDELVTAAMRDVDAETDTRIARLEELSGEAMAAQRAQDTEAMQALMGEITRHRTALNAAQAARGGARGRAERDRELRGGAHGQAPGGRSGRHRSSRPAWTSSRGSSREEDRAGARSRAAGGGPPATGRGAVVRPSCAARGVLALLLLPAATAAQTILNTERFQLDEVDGPHLSAEFSLSFQGGNARVLDASVSGMVGTLSGSNWLRAIFGGRYLSTRESSVLDAEFLQLRYSRVLSPATRTFHFLQFQRNRTLLLRSRWLAAFRRTGPTSSVSRRGTLALGTGG